VLTNNTYHIHNYITSEILYSFFFVIFTSQKFSTFTTVTLSLFVGLVILGKNNVYCILYYMKCDRDTKKNHTQSFNLRNKLPYFFASINLNKIHLLKFLIIC
jgi:hypothetical protein